MLSAIGPTAIKILRVLLDSRDRAPRLEKCAGAAPAYTSQTPSGQICQAGKSAKLWMPGRAFEPPTLFGVEPPRL